MGGTGLQPDARGIHGLTGDFVPGYSPLTAFASKAFQALLQRITQVLPEHLKVSLREIFLRRVVTHAPQFFFILFHRFLHKKVRNIWRMRKNGVSLHPEKKYMSKEQVSYWIEIADYDLWD